MVFVPLGAIANLARAEGARRDREIEQLQQDIGVICKIVGVVADSTTMSPAEMTRAQSILRAAEAERGERINKLIRDQQGPKWLRRILGRA